MRRPFILVLSIIIFCILANIIDDSELLKGWEETIFFVAGELAIFTYFIFRDNE